MIVRLKHIMLLCLAVLGNMALCKNGQSIVLMEVEGDTLKTNRIELLQADKWYYIRNENNDAQVIVGDVIFKHDSAWMFCDSALLHRTQNSLEAYGHVRIKENDTLQLFGDKLQYDGVSKTATVFDNVRVVNAQTELYTDKLTFDRNTQTAYYNTGGKIIDGDNILLSRFGYYETKRNFFRFNKDVKAYNPKYNLLSDTLHFDAENNVATAVDTTTMFNDKDTMTYLSGTYDFTSETGKFANNVYIRYDNHRLTADSVYYVSQNEYAEGYGHVVITDTSNAVTSWSDYMQFDNKTGYAFISGNAIVRSIDNVDTTYLHADTVYTFFDSVINKIRCYHNVKIVNNVFAGVCDSLVVRNEDSCATLYTLPAMWVEDTQITGDSILVFFGDSTVKYIKIPSCGFIASKDSLNDINQVKGNSVDIYFEDNRIDFVDVFGDVETIYFLNGDEGNVGVNNVTSENARMMFRSGEIDRFNFYVGVKSTLYPLEKAKEENKRLPGLRWRIDEKPTR